MNLVDRGALLEHRSAIHLDDDGRFYVWDIFEQVWATIHIATSREDAHGPLVLARRHLTATSSRLNDLRTVAAKLDWMLQALRNGHLGEEAWMYFAASDVVGFLTSTRSLLDHLARSLVAIAPKPGSLPGFSFNDLRKWLAKHQAKHSDLGEAQAELILGCAWFDEIKDLRDSLIHHDPKMIVFPTNESIQFQIYHDARILIHEPELIVEGNVASFEYLAASITAQLHHLLNASARAIADTTGLEIDASQGWSLHPGLGVLASWTDELINRIPDSDR